MASSFTRIIRFKADNGDTYYSDLGRETTIPVSGTNLSAYKSIDDLIAKKDGTSKTVGEILAPVPNPDLPLYCVGLNYRSHAQEANLSIPQNPPLWTKPKAALASPGEDIPINKFCASSLLDYEGELCFITSREVRDISVEEADSYILGYTAGNDISCRKHQMPGQMGGQFYFAKAFDKFAPIGPVLVSPAVVGDGTNFILRTKVNGEVMQEVECVKELIFSPARILSWASQGTTIPAGTVFMTGTPAGVGVFKEPRRFLEDGDIAEVEITGIGSLKNRMVFEK